MARRHPTLTLPQLEQVARLFRTLAEPSRLQILQALRGGPLTVGEIVKATDIKQANVSKQLGQLYDAGLLERERDGLHVRYTIADAMIFQLCELVCGKLSRDAKANAKSLSNLR